MIPMTEERISRDKEAQYSQPRSSHKGKEKMVPKQECINIIEPEIGADQNERVNSSSIKRPMFARIWSVQEELDLLRALERYQRKQAPEFKLHGKHSMDALLDYMKKKSPHLIHKYEKKQIFHKLKNLRSKYLKKILGEGLSRNDPFERELYELSRKIWFRGGRGKEDNGTEKRFPCLASALEQCRNGFPYLFQGSKMVDMIDPWKAEKLEKKWAKFQDNTLSHWTLLMRKTLDLLIETSRKPGGSQVEDN